MSRIGKRPVQLPDKVTATLEGQPRRFGAGEPLLGQVDPDLGY